MERELKKKIHNLKILAVYATAKLDGKKPFEIRLNDRDFRVGDLVKYTVIDDEEVNERMKNKVYKITYITSYEQKDGYIVFGDIEDGAAVLTKEEYEQLNKYINAVNVYEMQMKNGEIDMKIGSDNAKLFVSSLVNIFRQNGAKNFFAITVECTDNGEKYSLTVKKENGKSLAEATNDKVKQARKETAMEILDDIFSDYYRIGGGLYELTPCDKKFIYKKYGIEVE